MKLLSALLITIVGGSAGSALAEDCGFVRNIRVSSMGGSQFELHPSPVVARGTSHSFPSSGVISMLLEAKNHGNVVCFDSANVEIRVQD